MADTRQPVALGQADQGHDDSDLEHDHQNDDDGFQHPNLPAGLRVSPLVSHCTGVRDPAEGTRLTWCHSRAVAPVSR